MGRPAGGETSGAGVGNLLLALWAPPAIDANQYPVCDCGGLESVGADCGWVGNRLTRGQRVLKGLEQPVFIRSHVLRQAAHQFFALVKETIASAGTQVAAGFRRLSEQL